MVEDMPEDEGPAPDSGRAKRAPPTIDLEASEVSGETRKVGDGAQPERSSEAPSSPEPPAAAPAEDPDPPLDFHLLGEAKPAPKSTSGSAPSTSIFRKSNEAGACPAHPV